MVTRKKKVKLPNEVLASQCRTVPKTECFDQKVTVAVLIMLVMVVAIMLLVVVMLVMMVLVIMLTMVVIVMVMMDVVVVMVQDHLG